MNFLLNSCSWEEGMIYSLRISLQRSERGYFSTLTGHKRVNTGRQLKKREIIVTKNPETVAETGAELLFDAALDSVKRTGIFSIALSGGNTPKALYSLLADSNRRYRTAIPWERVHVFWGDERHVPPEHPASNYKMANDLLLSKIEICAENIHPIQTMGKTPETAAMEYENELKEFFGLKKDALPLFNLILLGIGNDGHTASLFPGSRLLKEKRQLVMADPVPRGSYQRISLTLPVLNNASLVLFLVGGGEKADTLKDVLEKPDANCPAGLVSPASGKIVWVIDRAASKLLQTGSLRA